MASAAKTMLKMAKASRLWLLPCHQMQVHSAFEFMKFQYLYWLLLASLVASIAVKFLTDRSANARLGWIGKGLQFLIACLLLLIVILSQFLILI
ncbi:hypothetical protein C1O66_04930 [Paucibacter aquatile]|uniref:Uncharacterized protein n=1 Tax=Kinneretia aquatilis TaxID=2070761 RepID=A0A2N8KU08_9BURK|nr:hypothetical protein C1O66_04930 [Paucibacter aquatile]